MQTFLPYSDYEITADILDLKRLGKQRVETLQVMTSLMTGRGWVNHPAVKMWQGYERSLMRYQEAICEKWKSLGYSDTCLDKTLLVLKENIGYIRKKEEDPWWLDDHRIHEGHQSNLVRKNPEYYRPLFPYIPDDLPYHWPV